MLEKDEAQTEVENLVMGNESESSTEEAPKEESSPEVKEEETPAEPAKVEEPKEEPAKEAEPAKDPEPEPAKPAEPVNVDKLQGQIENLNIALKKEREEGKQETAALKKQLEDSQAMMDRLKGAFAPEPEPEPEQDQSETEYMTPAQAEAFWQQKDQERAQKAEEESRAQAIKTEISTLESKWDGAEGKPKYEDSEVLEWQKANEKLYLSPSEAFQAMKANEIVDYEVKQRLAKRKPSQEVENPSVTPGEHDPKEVTPKNEAETRNAVIEAMNNADAEL